MSKNEPKITTFRPIEVVFITLDIMRNGARVWLIWILAEAAVLGIVLFSIKGLDTTLSFLYGFFPGKVLIVIKCVDFGTALHLFRVGACCDVFAVGSTA